MSEYNTDVYATGPSSLGMDRSMMALFEKRARLALVENGFVPGAASQLAAPPSSTSGKVDSTNYRGTTTFVASPYVLTYKDNTGNKITEGTNWTEKIRPGTFVMLSAAQRPSAVSGTSSAPVLLTLPQLNYQLHCEMRGRVAALVAGVDLSIPANMNKYKEDMVQEWRAVMNKALEWAPAGVMKTSNDDVPTPSLSSAQRHAKVVQKSGLSFVQNIWGGSVCCGSTLWIRLGTSIHSARNPKTYILGDNVVATVPPIPADIHYQVPRFEAVVSNIGHTIGLENMMLAPERDADAFKLGKRSSGARSEFTEIYKIGVCFDLTGLPRSVRSSAAAPVRINEVSVYESPGMTNQIQILLSGEM